MNARQKAKYWKNRYEMIANTRIPEIKGVMKRVQTLKVKEIINEREKDIPLIQDYVESRLLRKFEEGLKPFVQTEYRNTPYGLEITKTLEVVEQT